MKKKVIIGCVIGLIVLLLGGFLLFNLSKDPKVCDGGDGKAVNCDTGEPMVCDDDLIPVIDGKGYRCVSYDEYNLSQDNDYNFKCIKKNMPDTDDYDDVFVNELNQLYKDEETCLYNEMDKELSNMISNYKSSLPTKYDIRDKVTVTAGDQGSSDTCVLWSLTKALEISAQLKKKNYQFLVDFEKKINSTNYTSSGVADENGNIQGGLQGYVPGNKRNITIMDFRTRHYDPTTSYPKYSSKLLSNYEEYIKVAGTSCSAVSNGYSCMPADNTKVPFDDYVSTINTFAVKKMIMEYGSAFIETDMEVGKFANGHMMIVIGWDDAKESWLVLNSWGNDWNDGELKSNGDGTTWIKYSNKDYRLDTQWYGNSIELLGE